MFRRVFLSCLCGLVAFVFAQESSGLELHLPLVYVYEVSAKDITMEEFIDTSYQPVLVTQALSRGTSEKLAPWNFAHLNTSLEAATTFCAVAGSGHDTKLKEEKSKQKKGKRGPESEAGDINEVSLRRFGLEGNGFWKQAFSNVTKDMGMLIRLPRFIEGFEFDTVKRAGLHYTRAGWSSEIDGSSRSFFSASVVCLLEGSLSLVLTPFQIPWNQLKCEEDTCTLTSAESIAQDTEKQMFLVQVDLAQRDCLFVPLQWMWQASSSVDSVSLRIIWEEDLSIREDVLQDLVSVEAELSLDGYDDSPEQEEPLSKTRSNSRRNRKKSSKNLWEVLPRTLRRSTPVLWSDKNPLLHLVRFYLLSTQQRNLTKFIHDFRVDRMILPDLVDCPSECQAAAKDIFILLDADADGILSPQDAIHLSQDTFNALSSQLDDFMDELKDLGVEQWNAVAMAGGDSHFMERAKDRMVEGVKVSMRRWVEGDMDEEEANIMKENSPELYADVMAARERKSNDAGKEEL